ncbi:MAG: hypothetical protein JKX78_03760 [Alteromonadaceae bacterium]|nr:hypothetical protein [Alteromonadaceae bacterium]MBL4909069.1 hypothetical protein [Alteromonadaceae bacterium]MBL4909135.1 hypothetical protein [Alteromonadaceae bacterium]
MGTDGQVPVADAASPTGIKWETPAAGSLIAADFNNLPAPAGFHMLGDVALGATHADNAVAPDLIKFDFVFFEATTTTINKISCASDTASNGGSMFVALHPMTAKGVIGNQSFVATITVGTAIDTEHEETIGTPWVVPRGHYAIVIGNNTATNLTNIISSISGNSASHVFGKHVTAKVIFRSDLENEAESRTMFMFKDDYIASPDLSSFDFNDVTNYVTSPSVNGDLALSTHVPIVLFRVDSTT